MISSIWATTLGPLMEHAPSKSYTNSLYRRSHDSLGWVATWSYWLATLLQPKLYVAYKSTISLTSILTDVYWALSALP